MTTQPELPEVAPLPVRPALYVAPPPAAEPDVDFDGFVRTYEARLRRLVMRRIGDLCEAEEITQETLLRAYQHRVSFATEDELMAWSTVVAQRLVIDRVRVRGRSIAVAEVPEHARLGRDTAEIVVARHEARAALESLEAIPTRQAAILWAREVEGLHYEEIAERFGITEPAVRSLLHRGRKALRKEFKDRTGSLPLNGLVPFAPWLLALKAAGKVRGVAKTTAKSSVTTVAALSISALVAVTGVGPMNGWLGGGARTTDIHTARGGATYVTTVVAPVDAVNQPSGELGQARAADFRPSAGYHHTFEGLPPVDAKIKVPCKTDANGCVRAGTDIGPFTGGEIQIGPDELPDNPLFLENVRVSSRYLDCSALGLPSSDLVKCRQRTDAQPLPPGKNPTTLTPQMPVEGAQR